MEKTKLMMQNLLLLVAVCGLASGPCLAEDQSALLDREHLGNLRIGSTAQEVSKTFASCRLQKDKAVRWEADGLYHQDWHDPACGISVDMVSENLEEGQAAASIAVRAPAKAQTGRGIGIGSSEAEVAKAYHAEMNAEDSQTGVQFVAGSIYGGLIFTINQGRVEKIFLGAAAE
jgi:hypothetical protein